jgi:hypothetical protein
MNITRIGTQPSAKGPEDWFTEAVQPNEKHCHGTTSNGMT